MPLSNDNVLSEEVESDVGDTIPDLGDGVDMPTFSQILEMDDGDPERSFSKSLLVDFLNQAEETFENIQNSIQKRDLKTLSEQGHYLKGSSATLGLIKVQGDCERIQRYGKKENVDGTPEPDEEKCLQRIKDTLKILKADYKEVAKVLNQFFHLEEEDEDEAEEDDEDEEGSESDAQSADIGASAKQEAAVAKESDKI